MTADRLPAGLLRAPTVCVPSLQHPHTPSFDCPLLSQSSAPHICCVLATDSKLQAPGPLPDSIPISSHVHADSLTPNPLTHLLCVRLSVSHLFSHFHLFFSPRVCHIRLGSSTSSTPVRFHPLFCLSFTSLLVLCSSLVSRYSTPPPLLSSRQVPVV